MAPLSLLAIAVALAMDAFAVALATGLRQGATLRQTLRLAWHFGLFQALMPVLGWAVGLHFASLMESVDHWIAFLLLLGVGGKMIWDSLQDHEEEELDRTDPTRGWTLVILAVATSIDALAVGLSLALLKLSVWWPAVVIGVVAAGFTALGLHLGRSLGSTRPLSRGAGLLGGLILVAIGLRILWEHGALS